MHCTQPWQFKSGNTWMQLVVAHFLAGASAHLSLISFNILADFKKAYDSVRREVLYKILSEFGIPKKLVRLIKMCLTETYSRVRVGKNSSDKFPIRNGLKQGNALSPLLFNFAFDFEIKWYTPASGLCR